MQIIGTWHTPRFTKIDILAILFTLIFQSLLRSWAYIEAQDGGADVFTLVKATMPLTYWAYLLLSGVGLLCIGIVLTNHFLIWLGHAWSTLVYFVLLIGILLTYFFGESTFYASFVYVGLLSTPLILHGVFSIRMGASPLDPTHDVHTIETVVGDNGQ